MTPDEADEQVRAWCRRLGTTAPPALPCTGTVGEHLLGFAHAGEVLSVTVLVYRFRAEPRPAVLTEVWAEATPENTGGGRLVLDGRALVLRREITERVPDARFAADVTALADAGLRWVRELLARAAERANTRQGREP